MSFSSKTVKMSSGRETRGLNVVGPNATSHQGEKEDFVYGELWNQLMKEHGLNEWMYEGPSNSARIIEAEIKPAIKVSVIQYGLLVEESDSKGATSQPSCIVDITKKVAELQIRPNRQVPRPA